jgi:hypothetical protein
MAGRSNNEKPRDAGLFVTDAALEISASSS